MNDEVPPRGPRRGVPKGLTLRALVPNAITAAALCAGLTGIRFAITGEFRMAVATLAALIHDLLIVVGLYAVFQFPVLRMRK